MPSKQVISTFDLTSSFYISSSSLCQNFKIYANCRREDMEKLEKSSFICSLTSKRCIFSVPRKNTTSAYSSVYFLSLLSFGMKLPTIGATFSRLSHRTCHVTTGSKNIVLKSVIKPLVSTVHQIFFRFWLTCALTCQIKNGISAALDKYGWH